MKSNVSLFHTERRTEIVESRYERIRNCFDRHQPGKNILEVSTVNDELREEILAYLQEGGYPKEIISFEHSDGYVELE